IECNITGACSPIYRFYVDYLRIFSSRFEALFKLLYRWEPRCAQLQHSHCRNSFLFTNCLLIHLAKLQTSQPRKVDRDTTQCPSAHSYTYLIFLTSPFPNIDSVTLSPVDVTLDPDTANPWLILSEDRKRVRRGNKCQDLPNNPERFDHCYCVLGAEGFTGGRRYWEVEVGLKTGWDLGVCRESVRRKGKVTYTPGNGYWVMWLRDGKYKASTSPCTLLSVSIRPKQVGIFLDCEAGEVSFYNVTDRSHLFTFTDTFSGTLRPYFHPYLTPQHRLSLPSATDLPAPSGGGQLLQELDFL
uniref:B30.2/SPRY domain-containing protein n=1 Tax=Chrysemys picta bellii TaxID=8478 RepID=A0A8C3H7B2_CHRPI